MHDLPSSDGGATPARTDGLYSALTSKQVHGVEVKANCFIYFLVSPIEFDFSLPYAKKRKMIAVAVAGYFFGGLTLYIQIFEGAKMSILAIV